MHRLAFASLVVFCVSLAACSDDSTVHLQPGLRYVIRKDAGVVPCPGKWSDYDRLDGMSHTDRLRTVLTDGGTMFVGGDSFTVVGFGSGLEAPVRIRSNVNNELCWLTDDVIRDLIGKSGG